MDKYSVIIIKNKELLSLKIKAKNNEDLHKKISHYSPEEVVQIKSDKNGKCLVKSNDSKLNAEIYANEITRNRRGRCKVFIT